MLRRSGGELLRLLSQSASCSAAAAAGGGSASHQLQQTRAINFFDAPNGPAVKLEDIEDSWYNRQRPKLSLLDKTPWTQPDTWIAPNAVVAGDVDIYDQVRSIDCRGLMRELSVMLRPPSPGKRARKHAMPLPCQVMGFHRLHYRCQVAIFYGAVLRGDLGKIRIGANSVVLDRAVIHTARSADTDEYIGIDTWSFNGGGDWQRKRPRLEQSPIPQIFPVICSCSSERCPPA
jgi:hypothetical protein